MWILISILDIFAPRAYKWSVTCTSDFCSPACFCERFEPRSHFLSRLSMIVWVNVVLNRTVVVVDSDWRFDNLSSSHLQSQSELYHASWWYWHNSLWLWRWLHAAQVVETTTVLFRSMFTWTIILNLPTSCFYCQYDLMFAGPKIPKPYRENNVWPMKPLWINVHTVRCRMAMPFVQKKVREE